MVIPSEEKQRVLALAGVAILASILIIWNLGAIRQFSRAELYFAETAREMLVVFNFFFRSRMESPVALDMAS